MKILLKDLETPPMRESFLTFDLCFEVISSEIGHQHIHLRGDSLPVHMKIDKGRSY